MSDPTPTPASAIDRDNPWPGLASFTEDLRGFFFGREKETEELVRLVRRNTLTVLFGQSGLGKSSLLQAGVFPLLREDFLPDLEGLKTEMRSLMHNRMRVKRLTGTQALEIVTRPAPHLLAEGVAERMVEFVAGARGGSAERLAEMEVEPSLLSVICRELNQRRRTLGQEQITADLVSGNRREILNDFYERSVADLPVAMREYVEDHLLTKSGFRDNLALETVLEAPGVTRALVDTLVSRRLLRIEDRLGVQRVELTHDVLADVISASRDSRRERQALDEAQRQLVAQKEREAATRRALYRARAIALVAIIVMLLAAGSAVFSPTEPLLVFASTMSTPPADGGRRPPRCIFGTPRRGSWWRSIRSKRPAWVWSFPGMDRHW